RFTRECISISVPVTPSTVTVRYELMLRGTGTTRVDDQSTVWQNECASSGLMPASSSPASATCAMFTSGGTLTVGLGDCTIRTQESVESGAGFGRCEPPEAGGCP